jgi:hypothetical protein
MGVAVASVNYSSPSATISWVNMTVHNNGVFPTFAPPTLPFQVIEDVSPNCMNAYYDFTNNLSTCVSLPN